MEIPEDAIPPSLPGECAFAYAAFRELITDRELGFGEGPIRWTAINEFGRRYGLRSRDEFDVFVSYIRVMDEIWLRHNNKKNP